LGGWPIGSLAFQNLSGSFADENKERFMEVSAAKRMDKVSTYFFAELQEKIKKLKADGHDVIRMDIGSPDMAPPQEIVEALYHAASKPDAHGYQPSRGTDAIRQAWAGMYHRTLDVELDPESQILPLIGSKEGIFNITQALVDPGDVVLVPDPGYPIYRSSAWIAGGEPYFMPLLSENDFLPNLGAIPNDILKRAKLMWLNYPNNPTTAFAPKSFYEEVVQLAQKHNILVCHDAAYSQVYFDEHKPSSLLSVPGAEKVGVEFNSLSKSHNMAGWRLGVVVGNEKVIHTLLTMKSNIDTGSFLPIMHAATTAMSVDQSWLTERNEVYRSRRDVVFDQLLKMGFETQRPKATIYVWARVPAGMKSAQFAEKLLFESHVSVAPGMMFGQSGEGYFRISLVQNEDRLLEAMERMAEIV
jgi:LL-diaminopimelate aminotransferase